MKFCVQAGHINTIYNSDPSLRSSTGAPGEQELTLRIANRLCEILRSAGQEVKQTDANANSDPAVLNTDWSLFLSIHGDADYAGDNGGGFIATPDPSVDFATVESSRIAEALRSEYFKHSEIAHTPHYNDNTRYYYMWRVLSAKTPCVLVELGQVQDPHDKVLLADTERIAKALAYGIFKALNIPTVVLEPVQPSTVPHDYKQDLITIKTIVWGRGWPWQKMVLIKSVLANAGV